MKVARSFVTDEIKSTTVDRVLVHGMSIRKAACRLIYSIFTLLTHYIYSTSDERNVTILCTVNTVAHSIKLVTVELIGS